MNQRFMGANLGLIVVISSPIRARSAMYRSTAVTASLTILSLLLLVGFLPAHASNGGPSGDGIITVTVPTTVHPQADYFASCPGQLAGCTAPFSTSWSDDVYSVTGTGTITIAVTDCCYHADYYSLWKTSDPSGLTGWTLVGTTPAVHTDSNLVAPTFNPLWDGSGSTYSAGTFTTSVSGTTLFAVRDELFDPMVAALASSCGGASVLLSIGCASSSVFVNNSFSPAGLTVTFSEVTSIGVPQFPIGPLLLFALALPALFLLRSRFVRLH